MRNAAMAVVMVVLFLSLAGCGTIIHGGTKPINLNSDPAGAEVRLASMTVRTPATVTLERRYNHTAIFTMPGYSTQQVEIRKTLDPWIFGNLLFATIPGVVVDLITGSAADLKPDTINVRLQPVEAQKEEQ